ncbi:MAG: PIG-L family deacetylase [Pseudohongiella sp.]|nr:PIG-L family deacetylase [Pseudohongiella sp.]
MTPEHILVPYQSCQLPEGPWLVFAPHADDETFGMGGALRLAANAGVKTHVIVLTDGALGGPYAAGTPEAAALVLRRQQEVEQACQILGVNSLQTWDQPDRGLLPQDNLIERVLSAITKLSAATVFFPGVLELHPDHRGTAQVVWQALQRLYQRPWRGQRPNAWSYEISVQSPVNRLMDITAVRAAKEQAMQVYVSQNSQNNYPEMILALNKARTFSMPADCSHAEAFYAYPAVDISLDLAQAAQKAFTPYFVDTQF